MFAIARKYTVAVDEIRNWNDLQTDKLKTGQQLRIIKTDNARDQTAR
jgi:LysM repeat protein